MESVLVQWPFLMVILGVVAEVLGVEALGVLVVGLLGVLLEGVFVLELPQATMERTSSMLRTAHRAFFVSFIFTSS